VIIAIKKWREGKSIADLSIRIKANFDEAAAQFKALAESSEYTADKISRFTEKFKSEQVDKFIDRQNLAAVAMQATGRETDALNSQVAAYQREIERLIKAGLDPQDEALQKLQGEYSNLLIKQDEMNRLAKDASDAEKEKAAQLADVAKITADVLTATTDYEKQSIILKHQQQELREEIERLIKAGYDPESRTVKGLEEDYQKLTREVKANEAAHRAQEAAVKAAKNALLGIGAIIAAGVAITAKAAAANEDMIASFVPMMGGSVEKATALFKTIQKEAATTPFEIDKIAASVKTLMPAFAGSADAAKDAFRMLGDTAQGNAQKLETITNAYTKSMLKGKVSMQEINMIANTGVPIYTELAKSMGVTEAQMMEMSKKGKITSDDLTKAFQSMTGEGGIFFKGMETASDTFNMRILGIKENLNILAGVIGESLLPVAKNIAGAVLNAVESFTKWIQEGENLRKMTNALIYVLSGLAAGFTAFLIIAKGHVLITAIANAFRGLTAAMAANPIGVIAVVITAVLIPALIALYKNWDVVQTYLQQGIARLEYAFKWFASQIQEKFTVAVNGVKIAFISLAEIIVSRVLGAVANLLNALSHIPYIGQQFQAAANSVTAFSASFTQLTNEANAASQQAIQAAQTEQNAIRATLNTTLNAVDARSRARRAELEAKRRQVAEEQELDSEQALAEQKALDAHKAANKKKIKTALELLRARLEEEKLTETQAINEQTNAVAQFLQQRGEMEGVYGKDRITFMQNMRDELLANEKYTAQNRIAIEKAANEAIAENEKALLEQRLTAFSGFFSAMASMIDASNKESVEAFYIARGLASAEAFVNSYLAFTKALNDPTPMPTAVRAFQAAGILASGLAAQVNIWKQQPSFETGGSFIVPDVSPRRVDGMGFRANPGERIDITPRGMSGQDNTFTINLLLDGQVLAYATNKLARRGELYTLQLAGNL